MSFTVKTPELVTAMRAFEQVIDQTKSDTLELAKGRIIINAGKGIVQAVGQELKVRLAAPKLAAIEVAKPL